MLCPDCANVGTLRGGQRCQTCAEDRQRSISLTKLHARHVVAMLVAMGAKPAPVTDHSLRMKKCLFETFGSPYPASIGSSDDRDNWMHVISEVRSCWSATSSKQPAPSIPMPSSATGAATDTPSC